MCLDYFPPFECAEEARRPKLHKGIGKQKIYAFTSNITIFSCHRLPVTVINMKV
jgi:hypothetical protein